MALNSAQKVFAQKQTDQMASKPIWFLAEKISGITVLRSPAHQSETQIVAESQIKRFAVSSENLPAQFPAHLHSAEFWEALGRTVATFGFLEETLGKAIFAFTGTREIPEEKIEEEIVKWRETLEKALSDPLGGLIDAYGKAVRENGGATIANLDSLLTDLRKASIVRNVLCHGSWRTPDADGRSLPLFVNRKKEVFQTPIDVAYLRQVQQRVVELTINVINTVTHMGWQFPGSRGPGKPIWRSQEAETGHD